MPATAQQLVPPRAAAVAGVIFSLLLGVSLVLIRLAVPAYQTDPGDWLTDPSRRTAVRMAIYLVPFAGIAFLWFIGVLRNRLGAMEDRFFATVFLGSGLLFVAILFVSATLAAALLQAVEHAETGLLHSETYFLIRQLVDASMNIFGIKMAGVFMISTSTIAFRTTILPRWLTYTGFGSAAVLLFSITAWPWIALVFPCWILVVSARILLFDLRSVRTDLGTAAVTVAKQL